jgi:hypothetical protein
MTPDELAPVALPRGASPALLEVVPHTCAIPTMGPDYAQIEAAILKKWLAADPSAAEYRKWLAGQEPVDLEARHG